MREWHDAALPRDCDHCAPSDALGRSAGMHTSSFAVLTLLLLAIAFAMFLVTPQEPRNSAGAETRTSFWSTQR